MLRSPDAHFPIDWSPAGETLQPLSLQTQRTSVPSFSTEVTTWSIDDFVVLAKGAGGAWLCVPRIDPRTIWSNRRPAVEVRVLVRDPGSSCSG